MRREETIFTCWSRK